MPPVGRRLAAPISLLALGALVSLVAHQLAYFAARSVAALSPALSHAGHGHLGHDHLSTQSAVVVPAAAVAASVVIVRWARRVGIGADLSGARLGAVGGALFLGQEAMEALTQTGGLGAMAANPATFIGAFLAPVVAWAAMLLLRQASDLVARWLDPPRAPVFPDLLALPRPADGVDRGRILHGSRLARGPPRSVLLTDR